MPKIPHPTPTMRVLAAIGRRVAARRDELKLSQMKLAERMDSSLLLVTHIETGQSNMRFSTFLKLADALGVSPAALLDGAA